MLARRPILVGAACLAAVGAALLAWQLRPTPRPFNVLLITLDTTRADRLGCYGAPGDPTPTIDRLAASGVVYEDACTVAPLTLPTHASIFTGLYPPQHGLRTNGHGRLPSGIPTLAETLHAAGYATGAFVSSFVLDARFGLDRGFDVYDGDLTGAADLDDHALRRRDGRRATDAALAWLPEHPRRPFFCWVHLYDPHAPYDARSREFGGRFDADPYSAGVAYADRQLQRLLDGLGQRGCLDRTLIVLLGDHGEGLGDHGERTHGLLLHQSTLRIPLIVSQPGVVPAGRRVTRPVSLVDVPRTVLACLGIRPPAKMGGHDLKCARPGDPAEASACCAFTDEAFLEHGWSPLRSLATAQWKYIRTTQPELYDRARDPGESRNLAAGLPGQLAIMEASLAELERTLAARDADVLHLSQRDRMALESLGYAGGKAPGLAAADGPPPPDVKQMLPHLNSVETAAERLRSGDPAAAVQKLEAVVRAAPDYIGARLLLGRARLRQNDHAAAEAMFLEVLARRPDWGQAHAELASSLAARGEMNQAVEHYKRALDIDPEAAPWHVSLGRAFVRLNRASEALAQFQTAIRLNPTLTEAHYQLGRLLFESGRSEAALEPLRTAVRYEPEAAGAHSYLAAALEDLGRLTEALPHARRAAELSPDSPETNRNLGKLWLRLHRPEEAVAAFRQALEAQPEHAETRRLLQEAKNSAQIPETKSP